jgi:hypothetical protein
MMKEETQVSLSVRGPDVVPADVASVLKMNFEPEFSDQRGDRFEVDGELVERIEGFCCFASRRSIPTSAAFEEHMCWMLDRLEPHQARLTEWLANGWTIVIKTYTVTDGASGGPTVKPDILRRLANLGVTTVWRTLAHHVWQSAKDK